MAASDDPAVPPLLALGVAVLAISTSAILVRWSDAPNVVKALYRVSFTVGALGPLAFRRRHRERSSIGRRDGVVAVTAGVLLAVHFVAWFESLDHTSVAASVTLVQAQPVFVVAGAWLLLGERVTRRSLVGIGVALVGMAWLSVGPALAGSMALAGTTYGNALALLGAIAAAGYVLAGRSLRRRLAVLPYVTVVYTACAAVLLVVALRRGTALLAYPPHEWVLFVAMAIGPGVLGHTVVNWALGHVESHVVSVSLLGEPVGSTLLAALLLSEVPTAGTLGGGAVVLAGIYVTASARRRVAGD
ncbi:DMT family transporter [Haloplanus rubicundus]|uniref:DMT family transporter n=1 Tax=Haloplanus rubicundus TaxID=1547898 RepID=A0A345EI92_9EURY|nr:DMT family transporter [Haloplanus rubicundus]AXG07996.1 DMT family transporter [Haloplanus rubicundus]AXG11914.1 DMT family transporter [Haloplanus rubicundus]